MGRRERKREAVREQIVAAAGRLFAERDYDVITVDEIAAGADVAKGTVYYHFPSKEDIAVALADSEFQQGLPIVEEMLAAGATAIDVLHASFAGGSGWAEQNPRLARATLAHVLRQVSVSPDVAQEQEGYGSLLSLLLRMVKIGQATGQIREDVAAMELARTLALLHAHTLLLCTTAPTAESTRDRMLRCLRTCLVGMALG